MSNGTLQLMLASGIQVFINIEQRMEALKRYLVGTCSVDESLLYSGPYEALLMELEEWFLLPNEMDYRRFDKIKASLFQLMGAESELLLRNTTYTMQLQYMTKKKLVDKEFNTWVEKIDYLSKFKENGGV